MDFNKVGKTSGKVIFSVLLIAISLGISSTALSFQYTAVKDKGRLQGQLTRKITQVAGVWARVKIVSGVISVLETIQVEGSIPVVGGLAISAEPLGWTDVVDNTLDHISDICLWAMGALAIEKMLLAISIWLSLRIVVPVCAVFIVIVIWNKKYTGQLKRIIASLIIISAGICSAVPLSLELSNVIETSILSSQIQETVNVIDGKSKEVERAGNDVDNSSFMDNLKRIGKGIATFFNSIKQTFDSFIDSMIDYIMCFILTNFLIPIGTLLGLKYLIGAILKYIGFSGNVQKQVPKE
ncbi:hypothetical protein FACS189496_1180 [Bacilli bacterium]|nr:hypothetical protein FACS189496_1180 [Bacilli bacterium]